MEVERFDDEQEWLDARKGCITGTRAGGLIGKRGGKLKGYYELIAERVAIPPTEENVMDRGKRLEEEALELFAARTGKKVSNDLIIWRREDDSRIAISPDGVMEPDEAAEVKCLSSASHIEAWIEKAIPDEYRAQAIQYFVVNDNLARLFFIFYDPRMPVDLFWVVLERKEVEEEITQSLALQRQVLKEVADLEQELTF